MKKSILLTDSEHEKVAVLTAEVVCERCGKDLGFLRLLVAAYLAKAQLAEDAVVEQCTKDPGYLQAVAKHYLADLGLSQHLTLLEESLGRSGVVMRLGFNPFDPEREKAAHRAVRLFNNRRQAVVLLAGLVVLALMGLFPPWQKNVYHYWAEPMGWPFNRHSRLVSSEFAGYDFAFATKPELNDPESWTQQGWKKTKYGWHIPLLLGQWLVWLIVIVVLCVALRDRRTFPQRVAELEAKRQGATA